MLLTKVNLIECIAFMLVLSKQGRPPRNSEKGPYAVVDEQCEDTTLDLLLRHFYLISWTLVSRFTTAPL